MKLKAFTLSLASLASLSLLVACSQRAQQLQQPAAQPQTQQTQQSQAASSSTENTNQAATSSSQNAPEAQPTNIDGTYTGQDEGDRITLVVTGTWTQVETDGEQEIKQVSFDAANQRMIIGDDVKIYAINGNQMIIDDMDREASDRIVLSK
ncbi:SP_0198 family lipoprotein [uncultured Streptococcus sp.]|uniref:SP_0198 family lipoprotein n=1 Tax=uncultured Streptococcus sp. TaxID=83427 RepID=UPI003211C313